MRKYFILWDIAMNPQLGSGLGSVLGLGLGSRLGLGLGLGLGSGLGLGLDSVRGSIIVSYKMKYLPLYVIVPLTVAQTIKELEPPRN